MNIKVMAVNAGSSSLKFKLYQMPEETVICNGIVERISLEMGIFKIKYNGKQDIAHMFIPNHEVAVRTVLDALIEKGIIADLEEIQGIGHRVVQGGKYFADSHEFDQYTIDKVEELISLAPLHNRPALVGLDAFKKALPHVGNVAIFDTSFHQSMEPQDYLYPINYDYYTKYDIRRYGAHGTSHQYLYQEGAKLIKDVKHPRIVTCHIGSGASLAAVKDGKSIATTMGLTPLGGLMMGTRCGDIDPSIVTYIAEKEGIDLKEMNRILNFESGFKGVSGISSDMRDIEAAVEKGDERAIISNQLFVRRIADFVAQYISRLGGADLIVFSAGIGENDPLFRKEVIDELKGAFGLVIDDEKNDFFNKKTGIISGSLSKIAIANIPTDEEIVIARDCVRILHLLD